MSTQYPHPRDLAMAANEGSAKRSRRGRTGIGIALLMLGAFSAAGLVWQYSAYGYLIDLLTEDERNMEVATAAFNVLVILAFLGAGIWNLAARRTRTMTPVITAAALSLIGLTFGVINSIEALITIGRMPSIWVVVTNVAVIWQAIRILRSRPALPAPGPIQQGQPQ